MGSVPQDQEPAEAEHGDDSAELAEDVYEDDFEELVVDEDDFEELVVDEDDLQDLVVDENDFEELVVDEDDFEELVVDEDDPAAEADHTAEPEPAMEAEEEPARKAYDAEGLLSQLQLRLRRLQPDWSSSRSDRLISCSDSDSEWGANPAAGPACNLHALTGCDCKPHHAIAPKFPKMCLPPPPTFSQGLAFDPCNFLFNYQFRISCNRLEVQWTLLALRPTTIWSSRRPWFGGNLLPGSQQHLTPHTYRQSTAPDPHTFRTHVHAPLQT